MSFKSFRQLQNEMNKMFEQAFNDDFFAHPFGDTPMLPAPAANAAAGEKKDGVVATTNNNNAVGFWGGFPSMKCDIVEKEKEYTVTAEVPGIPKESCKVTVENGVLKIVGERKAEKEEKKEGGYHRVERSFGKIERHLRLPANADAAAMQAKHDNGVLTINIPKSANAPAAQDVKIH